MNRIVAYHAIVGVGADMVEVDLDDFYTGDEVVAALRGITGQNRPPEILEALKVGALKNFKKYGVLGVRLIRCGDVCLVAKI